MWFLPFVTPICIFVAWNDMRAMKIPNLAVMALGLVFLVIGLIALPFTEYLWRLLQLVVVLAIGFVLNMRGAVGAGDAKFAAAMAPYFAFGDLREVFILAAAVLLAAFATHRLFGRFQRIRNLVPHWESWQRHDFPMGLGLSGCLLFYLLLAARYGM
jgi:prepilin peptidase CpaA